jgi:hypothetical protein
MAFTFNLDQPKRAMLWVFIVAQPRNGLVLAKSCYRIIDTLVGAPIAPLLVALFAQRRVLFLGNLGMWMGLCLFIPSVGGFQDRISCDAIGFINTSIAAIFLVSVSAVLFTAVAPEYPQAYAKGSCELHGAISSDLQILATRHVSANSRLRRVMNWYSSPLHCIPTTPIMVPPRMSRDSVG